MWTLALWLFASVGCWSHANAGSIRLLNTTVLGADPQTVNRLNGESFQQDPLVTFEGMQLFMLHTRCANLIPRIGYQYAVFYVEDVANASVRHPSVSRRALTGAWETFIMSDYNQTDDDGHDMCVMEAFMIEKIN